MEAQGNRPRVSSADAAASQNKLHKDAEIGLQVQYELTAKDAQDVRVIQTQLHVSPANKKAKSVAAKSAVAKQKPKGKKEKTESEAKSAKKVKTKAKASKASAPKALGTC